MPDASTTGASTNSGESVVYIKKEVGGRHYSLTDKGREALGFGSPELEAELDLSSLDPEAARDALREIANTGTDDDAREYLDGLGLNAGQMRQLARDLGVPSLAGVSKRQARDDIVRVLVSGRTSTRNIREGTKGYGVYRLPDDHPAADPLSSFRDMSADDARDALDLKKVPIRRISFAG